MISLTLSDVKAIATEQKDLYDSLPLLELLERHLLAAGAIYLKECNQHTRLVLDSGNYVGAGVKAFVNQQTNHVLPTGDIQWIQASSRLTDKDAARLILRIREVLRDEKVQVCQPPG